MDLTVSRLLSCLVLASVWISSQPLQAEESRCARIVSLAPSITEVLFDLGLGDRVVGVTRFCRYPSKALKLDKVGGVFDLNLEQIAALHPTHLFTLSESSGALEPLDRFGFAKTVVEHRGLTGIIESYRSIGKQCGVEAVASERIAQLKAEEQEIQERCSRNSRGSMRPLRVMVVVGRAKEGDASSYVYISGRDGFYSDVLSLVGAQNVNTERTVAVPTVSAEGIFSLNPDVILEVVNVDDGRVLETERSFWGRFARISAVVNNRVFILNEDFASIPGPRYILLAKKLSSLLCDS
jgi:iron complex transport system substrate-binding protein